MDRLVTWWGIVGLFMALWCVNFTLKMVANYRKLRAIEAELRKTLKEENDE